jgi:hypothetical protein
MRVFIARLLPEDAPKRQRLPPTKDALRRALFDRFFIVAYPIALTA